MLKLETPDKVYGRKASEETRAKMSATRRGRKMSEEFREKVKASWVSRREQKQKQNA